MPVNKIWLPTRRTPTPTAPRHKSPEGSTSLPLTPPLTPASTKPLEPASNHNIPYSKTTSNSDESPSNTGILISTSPTQFDPSRPPTYSPHPYSHVHAYSPISQWSSGFSSSSSSSNSLSGEESVDNNRGQQNGGLGGNQQDAGQSEVQQDTHSEHIADDIPEGIKCSARSTSIASLLSATTTSLIETSALPSPVSPIRTHRTLQELTSRFLFVTNVPRGASSQALKQTFITCGDLKGIFVRFQAEHGAIILAFFDIRHSVRAYRQIQAGDCSFLNDEVEDSAVEKKEGDNRKGEKKAWQGEKNELQNGREEGKLGVRFISVGELKGLIGPSNFVLQNDGDVIVSVRSVGGEIRLQENAKTKENMENTELSQEGRPYVDMSALQNVLASFGDLRSFERSSDEAFHIEYFDARDALSALTSLDGRVVLGVRLRLVVGTGDVDERYVDAKRDVGANDGTNLNTAVSSSSDSVISSNANPSVNSGARVNPALGIASANVNVNNVTYVSANGAASPAHTYSYAHGHTYTPSSSSPASKVTHVNSIPNPHTNSIPDGIQNEGQSYPTINSNLHVTTHAAYTFPMGTYSGSSDGYEHGAIYPHATPFSLVAPSYPPSATAFSPLAMSFPEAVHATQFSPHAVPFSPTWSPHALTFSPPSIFSAGSNIGAVYAAGSDASPEIAHSPSANAAHPSASAYSPHASAYSPNVSAYSPNSSPYSPMTPYDSHSLSIPFPAKESPILERRSSIDVLERRGSVDSGGYLLKEREAYHGQGAHGNDLHQDGKDHNLARGEQTRTHSPTNRGNTPTHRPHRHSISTYTVRSHTSSTPTPTPPSEAISRPMVSESEPPTPYTHVRPLEPTHTPLVHTRRVSNIYHFDSVKGLGADNGEAQAGNEEEEIATEDEVRVRSEGSVPPRPRSISVASETGSPVAGRLSLEPAAATGRPMAAHEWYNSLSALEQQIFLTQQHQQMVLAEQQRIYREQQMFGSPIDQHVFSLPSPANHQHHHPLLTGLIDQRHVSATDYLFAPNAEDIFISNPANNTNTNSNANATASAMPDHHHLPLRRHGARGRGMGEGVGVGPRSRALGEYGGARSAMDEILAASARGRVVLDGVVGTGEKEGQPERNRIDIGKIERGEETRTTVMIKNIPNKMSDRHLIEFINEVCPRKIDFLYLRMDFTNGCNVGYAFVNFIHVEDLLHFAKTKLGTKWNLFSSEKVLGMSYANYQGKEALIDKFRSSSIMDQRESWRPKLFYSYGPNQGLQEEFPAPTHMRRKERSSLLPSELHQTRALFHHPHSMRS